MKKPLLIARLNISELSYKNNYICLTPDQIDRKMITIDATFHTVRSINDSASFFYNSFSELAILKQGFESMLLSSTANERDITNAGLRAFDRLTFKMKTNEPFICEANKFCKTANNLIKYLDDNAIYSFYDSLDYILKKHKINYVWFEFLSEANRKDQFYFYNTNDLKILLDEALELVTNPNNKKLISNNRFYS